MSQSIALPIYRDYSNAQNTQTETQLTLPLNDARHFRACWRQNPLRVGLPEPKARVYVVCQKSNGLGDLFFGINMARELSKRAPKELEVCLVPRSSEEMFGLKGQGNFLNPEVALVHCQADRIPTLVVHGPVLTEECPFKPSAKTTVEHISEYSISGYSKYCDRSKILHPGLRKGEWGVFCDEDLYKYRKAMEFETKERADASILDLQDRDLLNKLKENPKNIFFGYTHSNRTAFQFVSGLMESSSQNFDVVIVCKQRLSNYKCFDSSFKEIYLSQKKIEGYKIKNLELWESVSGRWEKVFSYQSEEHQKRVRIFVTPGISHSDFLSSLKVAQSPVLLDGDASVMEGTLLGKVVLYGCASSHKNGLRNGFKQVIASLDNDKAKEVAAFWDIGFYDPDPFSSIEQVTAVCKAAMDPKVRQCYRQLSDRIFTQHNLGRKMCAFVANHFIRLGL